MQARPARCAPHCLVGDTRGVVFIEFIIAFVPIFVLFLGVVQLALLSVANLVVQHAAVAGARAASVVLDDDPRYYDGAARGDVSKVGATTNGGFERALAQRVGETGEAVQGFSLGGPRMTAIRNAVHVPLAAIAPEPGLFLYLISPTARAGLAQVLGSLPASRLIFGLTFWEPITTAVTFPKAAGSSELFGSQFTDTITIRVRVTHLVPCMVPVVSALMCKMLISIGKPAKPPVDTPKDRQARARKELRSAPGASMQKLFAFTRVVLLQAEATMPAQTATYQYASQRQEQKP
jgi:hypothetical protein